MGHRNIREDPAAILLTGTAGIDPLNDAEVLIETVKSDTFQEILFRMVKLDIVDGLVAVNPDLILLKSGHRFLFVNNEIPKPADILIG